MISVLCVYNDPKAMDELLVPGLRAQTVPWQELFLDNSPGIYASAAAALNDLGRRATGKYLMIVHQDIRIDDKAFLEKIEAQLDSLLPFGIAGVAGCGPISEATRTAITCGIPAKRPGELLLSPSEVQTVDECLFFIPRDVFGRQGFDVVTCDNWHLYAVDFCLSAKEAGLPVLVVPLEVYHRSAGVVGRAYFDSLAKVLRKHKGKAGKIYTTVGVWKTDHPGLRAHVYRFKFGLYLSRTGHVLVALRDKLRGGRA